MSMTQHNEIIANGGAPKDPSMDIIEITPAMAEAWLEMKSPNRIVRPEAVSRYARDMADDNWTMGASIVFNDRGEVDDGQHRLLACIAAQKTFRTFVIRGLPSEARINLDTGRTRTAGDLLRSLGEELPNDLAAAANFCIKVQRKTIIVDNTAVSRAHLLDWIAANPEIRRSVKFGAVVRQKVKLPGTTISSSHYLTSRVDANEADAFWETVANRAVGLEPGSPVLALRTWIENMRNKQHKPTTIHKTAIAIKAMNAWREGRPVSILTWKRGGTVREAFPDIYEDA